jgi:hypothetical protein
MAKSGSVPFDWMQPRRNPNAGKTEGARREAMYRTELEDRAALLHRLGHSRETTRARLAANLAWDFPPGTSPLNGTTVDAIVERVFGQNPAGKPAPRSKGGTR